MFGLKMFGMKLSGSKSSLAKVSARLPRLIPAFLMIAAALAGSSSQAQNRRPRRETNAVRKARIGRAIADTYTHRWEIAGGGGYLRFRSGQYLQKNSEIAFWMNGTYYLNEKLGITGEVRGAYGNAKVGNTIFNIANPQISEYPIMIGPTYRFYAKEKASVSGFVLGGIGIGKFDGGSKGIPAANLGLWPDTNAEGAFTVGANLDYNFYPNLAVRLAPSYLGTTYGGQIQNNAGFNIGVIYRFGRQK